jgi:diguanylate cyclase (GGDEF)-like protein/PAS domain S-box-containing protein
MARPSDRILAAALESFADGVVLTDATGEVLFVNEAVCLSTGYSREDLVGRNCRFLQGRDTDPAMVRAIAAALEAGVPFEGTILNYRHDGRPFWNALSIRPIVDADGTVTNHVSGQRDVTDVVELQEENSRMLLEATHQSETARMLLSVSQALGQRSSVADVAQTVAEAVPRVCGADRSAIGLWDADAGRLVIAAHSGWPDHLIDLVERFDARPESGPELAEIIASGAALLVDDRSSPWARELLETFEVSAFVGTPIFPGGEFRGIILAHWTSTPAPTDLDEVLTERLSGLAGLAAVALDNAELLRRAIVSATHDPLTGLPNRSLFEETLAAALDKAESTGADLAVLYCDVDRFKRTNDSYGHRFGDTVLVEVARRLRSVVRETDMVARIGGDEFVILLPVVQGADESRLIADRVRSAFVDPLAIGDRETFAQLAVGMAVRSEHASSLSSRDLADALMGSADADMYTRKARSRGTTSTASTPALLQIDADLRGAVARREIQAYFQPQFAAATRSVVGFEVLARWSHPRLGLLGPDRFIALAEDNGLIAEIGRDVFEQACAAIGAWAIAGPPLDVAVNVSTIQLLRPDFGDEVFETITRHGLQPDQVTLEITESRLLGSHDDVHMLIGRLRAAGLGIAIDDFGTGYSSLAQLTALPVSELKIDRSFVRDGPTGETLVAAIVGMSRSLGLRVVAEGVETREQLEKVTELGVDRVQGFLLGEPRPREESRVWLEETPR